MSPVLLPIFRVAFTLRDAKGIARGGAAQVRAASAEAAAAEARDLHKTAQQFTVVAIAA